MQKAIRNRGVSGLSHQQSFSDSAKPSLNYCEISEVDTQSEVKLLLSEYKQLQTRMKDISQKLGKYGVTVVP